MTHRNSKNKKWRYHFCSMSPKCWLLEELWNVPCYNLCACMENKRQKMLTAVHTFWKIFPTLLAVIWQPSTMERWRN